MRFDDLKLDLLSWLRLRSYGQSIILLLELLKPSREDVILDVGAGTGVIANKVSTSCDEIFALEPNQGNVDYMRRKFPEVKSFVGTAENIQFPESYFTKIYVVNSFHHFENSDQAILEFERILKPGGLVLIHEINPKSMISKIEKSLSKLNIQNPESLQEKFELEGFQTAQLERTKQGYFLLFHKV